MPPRPGDTAAAASRDLSRPLPAALSWIALAVIAGAFAVAYVVLSLPWWIPALYAVLSVLAFVAYAIDKRAARRGDRRTSEQALLTLGQPPSSFSGTRRVSGRSATRSGSR